MWLWGSVLRPHVYFTYNRQGTTTSFVVSSQMDMYFRWLGSCAYLWGYIEQKAGIDNFDYGKKLWW